MEEKTTLLNCQVDGVEGKKGGKRMCPCAPVHAVQACAWSS